ncbi:hypothetical protein LPE01_32370 [Lactiplantibacillus pentosus]|nr:hypothetical protein SN13T_4024 [Lactiplantibacillus plantarum]GEO51876.1 hypothetical protein LPE01_32370 [Lactiplantibacillus pentosus]
MSLGVLNGRKKAIQNLAYDQAAIDGTIRSLFELVQGIRFTRFSIVNEHVLVNRTVWIKNIGLF